MPVWADYNKTIGNNKREISQLTDWDDSEIVCHFVVNGLYSNIKENKLNITVSVYDENNKIAFFLFKKTKLGITGCYSAIYKQYHGCGIGKKVYRKVLKFYGKIVSSYSLTGETGYGSFNLYKSLSKNKSVKTSIINVRTNKKTRITKIDRNLMGNFYERFCLSV